MSVLTPGGVFQETTNLLKNSAPVVTGSDVSGQNLTLHSNNSVVKGTVLLDENTPAYGPNSGAMQAIGGISSQHNVVAGGALMHSPYMQSVVNVTIPFNFGGSYGVLAAYPVVPTVTFSPPSVPGGVQAQGVPVINNIQLIANTGNGSTQTLTYIAQALPPFVVNQWITITGAVPTTLNGTYQVASCTTTQTTFSSAANATATTFGFVNGGISGVTITNPGTGYTTQPTVTFSDPTPTSFGTIALVYLNLVPQVGQFVKAYQPATGQIYYYLTTAAAAFTSIPSFVNGSSAAAGPTLTFVGIAAQGQSVLGYSGVVSQGAIHEVGSVYQAVITQTGAGYTQAPLVTFSPPQMSGGRTAQGIAQMGVPWTAYIATGGITTNGTTWTVNTTGQAISYITGSIVTLNGLVPAAYNGTYVITGASTTQFTIANTAQPGAVTTAGYVTVNMTGTVNNIMITDPGSGYTSAPTITITPTAGTFTTTALATAVIGSPGVKPIVSTVPVSTTGGYYPNTYYLDFGLTGPDTVYLNLTANSTIYFDNIAGTQSAYVNTGGIATNGTIWTFTTGVQPVSYQNGQQVLVQGVVPVAYNGVYTITTGSSTTGFTITNAAQPGAVTTAGIVTILPTFINKGFPQGRKITLYVKNSSAGTLTLSLPNLNPGNTSSGTSQPTISVSRTARFELTVLGDKNHANDVFMTTITS